MFQTSSFISYNLYLYDVKNVLHYNKIYTPVVLLGTKMYNTETHHCWYCG